MKKLLTAILLPIMCVRSFHCSYLWIFLAVTLVTCLRGIHGQSCGPRVSARLLAEIPCDMGKNSYCSAPGSAYPWSSVKRYINDNQGLVRRMYGDELHSSVLLNEIDGFKFKYEQLRSFMNRGYSRTEYGRSARGSRRQPRPQIFDDDDDDDTPATIFRVVTETSIKVGDPVTKPMSSNPTQTPTYKPATADYDHTSTKYPSETTTATTSSTTEQTSQTEPTTTETIMDTTYTKTTAAETTTTREPTTTETTAQSTTSTIPDLPVAMERIGHEDIDDYDYEPDRKTESGVRQNSVEEKTKYKHDSQDIKRNDPMKYDDASIYEVVADDVTKEPVTKTTKAKDKEDEPDEEEIPRRGINACPVKNEVIAPYWANNTRGETLALLNVHPFEQYVHFEKCAFENHQMLCREGCRCEQQYRLHRLLAFDPKNECRGIFSDWFRFPSCCVCICYDLTPDIPRTRSRKARM